MELANELRRILDNISYYYRANPGVGHTQAVLHGSMSIPGTRVMVGSHQHGRYSPFAHWLSVQTDTNQLIGARGGPLVWDPDGVVALIEIAIRAVEEHSKVIDKLQDALVDEKIAGDRDRCRAAERELHYLELLDRLTQMATLAALQCPLFIHHEPEDYAPYDRED